MTGMLLGRVKNIIESKALESKLLEITEFASNMRVAKYSCGMEILVSYENAVAGKDRLGWFRTKQTWSNTTSKHINTYGAKDGRYVDQMWLDKLWH